MLPRNFSSQSELVTVALFSDFQGVAGENKKMAEKSWISEGPRIQLSLIIVLNAIDFDNLMLNVCHPPIKCNFEKL